VWFHNLALRGGRHPRDGGSERILAGQSLWASQERDSHCCHDPMSSSFCSLRLAGLSGQIRPLGQDDV
jgi:hypothetical protein